MIYFDNAASGYFKPSSSFSAAENAIKNLSVNAGRSAHKLAVEAQKIIFGTRKFLSKIFNNGVIERVIFTHNCTEALNFAIFGAPLRYGEIVTTVTEHNSVLRPLYRLQRSGVKIKFATFSDKPFIQAKDILPLIGKKTDMVVMNAVSNVTGYKNEYERVGEYLKNLKTTFIVDGAQAGGHIDIDMSRDNIDCLCLAGHKGLFSIQGAGVLLFGGKTEISPTLFGGTGSESFSEVPAFYPDILESGTMNLPAIASLGAGAKYAYENSASIYGTLLDYTKRLTSALGSFSKIKLYSSPNPCGIVSFSHEDFDPSTLADILDEKYDIAVRAGFHCAPLIHEALGTADGGLVRASLSPYNSAKEVDEFIKVLLSVG